MKIIRQYHTGLTIECDKNVLIIGEDAKISWSDHDIDNEHLTNLIADIIFYCDIKINRLLDVVNELRD